MRDPADPWQDELTAATPTPVLTPTDHELRQRAIRNCRLCDRDGYTGTQLCTHQTGYAQAAQRGMAQIRAQMGWQPTTPHQTPENAPETPTAPATGIQGHPQTPQTHTNGT